MWHGPYPEIPPRLTSAHCIRCKKPFEGGHRRIPVFIISAIGTHPSGAGRAAFACRIPEFRHASCTDPAHRQGRVPKKRHPRTFQKDLMYPDIDPRFPTYICALCQKEFAVGDRVEMAYIILGAGIDPLSSHPEAVASENFEVVHADCEDPKLNGLGISLILSS